MVLQLEQAGGSFTEDRGLVGVGAGRLANHIERLG
jgi:hypothetical protein